MNEITKLAFIDELEKIGYIDDQMVEHLLKEAALVPNPFTALRNARKASRLRQAVRATRATPKMTPEQIMESQRAMRAAAPRAGAGPQLRVRAPSTGSTAAGSVRRSGTSLGQFGQAA
jgi:hypothetical protein